MRIKICGITQPEQGQAIANLGATALGFICVRQSPRYIMPAQIQAIINELETPVDRIGVFVDTSVEEIQTVVAIAQLTAIQLHGNESPQFCQTLRTALPHCELIKAFRVKDSEVLDRTKDYETVVDTLLLDAYHPHAQHPGQYGGTGQAIEWNLLQTFQPTIPWLLSGGLTPENVLDALQLSQPSGIDVSSGVEIAPGNKDLEKVQQLLGRLRSHTSLHQ
jgi:phosphoribosylanthranilate isomerase